MNASITIHADALTVPLKPSSYDLIVTHFFLDCFDAPGLERLIDRIQEAAEPGALWLISEFREPRWARPLLTVMYLFFRVSRRIVESTPGRPPAACSSAAASGCCARKPPAAGCWLRSSGSDHNSASIVSTSSSVR